jgi:hypothetical protein
MVKVNLVLRSSMRRAMFSTNGSVTSDTASPTNVTVEDEVRRKFKKQRSERLFHVLDYLHLISPIGLIVCFAGKIIHLTVAP